MLNPIFLALLVFGIWISYSDIKKGKIKNYSLLSLILVAIFINIYFTRAFIDFPLVSFFNILGALVAGIMIWIAGIWSAADAKLFIAINFLFPVTFYENWPGYFPGFSILINSAIPLFLFLFFQTLIKTSLKEKKEALISYLKPFFILRLLLISSAIFCLTFYISHFLKIRIEYLLWLILLFLLFWFVEEKLKINLTYFFILILLFSLLFALIFDLPLFSPYSLSYVLTFFSLIFFLFVILTLSIPIFTNSIKIDSLKEGMIPAEMIVEEDGKFVKKPITFLTFLVLLRERARWKPKIGFNPDGLEKEEVEEIQSLYKKGLLKFEELKISLTIPFAPILFFGALLTYFSKAVFINFFF
jgi:hypothetical protein